MVFDHIWFLKISHIGNLKKNCLENYINRIVQFPENQSRDNKNQEMDYMYESYYMSHTLNLSVHLVLKFFFLKLDVRKLELPNKWCVS
jgi:hypothetical protein